MNITQNHEQPALLEGPAEQTRILEILKRHVAEPLKAKVHEVEVLRNDGMRRAREVERERVFDGAEVMQLKDEVLGKVLLRAPDDPADPDVRQAELVARSVDGDDAWDAEVPLELRSREGSDEATGRAINVDRDGMTCLLLVLVE